MGEDDLPDLYARAQGRTTAEGECRHIWQITTTHVTYVCYRHVNITTLWEQHLLNKPTMHHHHQPLHY